MMDIKLSVMVPVYNVEDYIQRGIESILNQTYKNLEIILVDDGSSDKSGKICDEYAEKDSRIRVIHKENGGIVSARKAAVSVATGEYLINQDPDDWIEEDAYKNAVDIIEKYEPDIYAFGMIKQYEDFEEERPISMEEGFYQGKEFWENFNSIVNEDYFFSQPIDMSQCNKIIKLELIKKNELKCSENLKKNVDDAVILPCLLETESIYIDKRCWYHYCVRKSSILWQSDNRDYERSFDLAKFLLKKCLEFQKDLPVAKNFILYKIIHHIMLDAPEKFFVEDKCLIYPDLKKNSNIVIYGKGVFANRIVNRIKCLNYCNIIENIDSKDVEKIIGMEKMYDYIVVAVFNSNIVSAILNVLEKYNIPKEKIIFIEKEKITSNILRNDIKMLYDKL